jgi:large subunit ribosomal protein L3
MTGLIGKKIGMTRMFDEESGRTIPVTVIQTGMNIVQQVKTADRDGYAAVQLGFDPVSETKVSKPKAGHYKKLGIEPTRYTKEFALDSADEELKPGQKIGVELFENVKFVDVVGVSKGRGFAGTVRRHNFHLGRATHGNTNYRERGSLGAGTYPARVFPGVKMAGQYGASRVTAKNLRCIGIDRELSLVYVKGAVPGSNKGIVFIKKAK